MEKLKEKTLIGNSMYIVKNKGKYDKYYLESNDRQLSPTVSKITYDVENQVFFMQDCIYIDDTLSTNIYYYINMEGKVVGLGYCDLLDNMFSVQLSNIEDLFAFQTYDKFKIKLLRQINQTIQQRLNHHEECAKKMLICNKKDDISES